MGLLRPVRDQPTPTQAAWSEPPVYGMVAAATRVDIRPTGVAAKKKSMQADWQAEAWHHYNRCGELQMAASWMANSLSRIRIYAAEIGPDGRPGDPTTNVTAQAIAAELFGGPGAAAQVLAALGVHLTVPGDCYVVCEEIQVKDDDGTPIPGQTIDDWFVISTSELVKKDGTLGIDRGDGWRALDEDAVLIRIWNPHPQQREQATSPTRATLPVLRELERLDEHTMATLESRLAGMGILFVPDSVQFRAATPQAQAANPEVDQFLLMLTETMMTAVENRDSPSARVPIVVKVPEAALDKIKHITFGSELTAQTKENREECIRRLALGMDMPPEQLLGTGSANDWGSWQIEEGGIKVHVEPKAVTVCSALTESYFRPALKAANVPNPERYVLWYDVTELVLRPNRGDAAKTLHDVDVVSDAVLLRETGFDPETDAPDAEEIERRLLTRLLVAHPVELAQYILPALGITDVTIPAPAPSGPPGGFGGGGAPFGGAATPAGERSPTGETEPGTGPRTAIPDTDPGDSGRPAEKGEGGAPAPVQSLVLSAQEVAVEHLVSRGLEFAGKRLLTRGRRGQFADVDVRQMYRQEGVAVGRDDVTRLLDGAWAYLAETAAQVGLDAARLQGHLTDHVGGLLTTGQPHEARYSRTIARLSS